MFLRRRNIQPDVIDTMHLHDVLLEIMVAIDPAFNGEESDVSSSGRGDGSGKTTVHVEPGQSTYEALIAAGYSV